MWTLMRSVQIERKEICKAVLFIVIELSKSKILKTYLIYRMLSVYQTYHSDLIYTSNLQDLPDY